MPILISSGSSGVGVRVGCTAFRRGPSNRLHHVGVGAERFVYAPAKIQQCSAIPSVASIISKDMFILTCKATFKLGLACSAVLFLMKSGRLPAATPQILSKVAFNVTIPCALLVKSAETLAMSQGDPRYLMVSVTATLQVLIGFALGHFAGAWAARPERMPPSPAQVAIASSVAKSAGAPAMAPSLYPPPAAAPPGLRALVQTACAFGNSLTLPLLFLVSLVPAAQEGLATGAVALFLLGWSPMFWTLGLRRLTTAADAMLKGQPGAGVGEGEAPPAQPGNGGGGGSGGSIPGVRLSPINSGTAAAPAAAAVPPPLAPIAPSALPTHMAQLPSVAELRRMEASGAAVPRFIADPPGATAAGAAVVDGSSNGDGGGGDRAVRRSSGNSLGSADEPEIVQISGGLIPINGGRFGEDADRDVYPKIKMTPIANPDETPNIELPLLGRGAKRRSTQLLGQPAVVDGGSPGWLQVIKRVINPPLAATACGLVLGLSPFGPLLLSPNHPAVVDFVSRLPWELSGALATLRCAAETMLLLGSATLVIQLIVLGASLLPPPSAAAAGAADSGAAAEGSWAALARVLLPGDRWEARLLAATAAVRLVLLPACTLALVHALRGAGALPPCRVCAGALLLQSCMPSAQNLVLMVNLREETKSLVPVMARLLFRQYLLAVVPMTVWISVFATYLGLHAV
eukprot:jgi/Ulvmu1/3912/UM018_0135.1